MSINYLFFIICSVVIFVHGIDPDYKYSFFEENDNDENLNGTFQLPDAVEPVQYDLKITPNFTTFSYDGSVLIELKIIRPTKHIILHAKDLAIISVELNSYYGIKYTTTYQLIPENDILNITSNYGLTAGSSKTLTINFQGKLNDDMAGFYRSSYKNENTIKWLAATQFESTDARRAFPCFDEPKFKAKFVVRLVTDPQYFVMSNMPKRKTTALSPRNEHEFEKTPLMPTYLVAFMVAESSVIITDELNKYSVWARENAIQDSAYALNIGPKFLQTMESYTTIPYIFPKMDLVALPDFSAGAMENSGMITFRERAIQYNEYINSDQDKQKITLVIAHETVHQWFGNYITPHWWSYLWLKEGFARYFQYKITNMVQPDWRIEEFFVPSVLQTVLREDGIHIHRAMTNPVLTPTEIRQQYNVISYEKGASVLRMLEYIVSPEIFRKALTKYLQDRYKDNSLAKPEDLWIAFKELLEKHAVLPSNISISDIMTRWTTYTGYPLLTVSRQQQLQKSVIVIEQKPYNASYKSPTKEISDDKKEWIVPVSYTTHFTRNFVNLQPTTWLVPGQKKVIEEYIPSNQWIILNLQQTGYYRVNYDIENWQLLIKQLKTDPNAIHTLNRAQLIDDSWTLAEDNILPYNIPFELTSYLPNEMDATPWFSALWHFEYVYSLFEDTSVKDLLREFLGEQLAHQYDRVGFYTEKSDDHLTKVLRTPLIALACRLNFADCNNYAEKIYKRNIFDLSKIPASVKTTVFCAALNGKKYPLSEVWNDLWKLYSTSNSAHEKEALLHAAACVKCSHHLKMYLQKLIDQNDNDIRKQDYYTVYRAVLSTPYGVTVALQFVDDYLSQNPTALKPHVKEVLTKIVGQTMRKITNRKQIDILQKLFSKAETNATDDLVTKYMKKLEAAVQRVEQIQLKQKEIAAVLSARVKSKNNSSVPTSMSSLVITLVGWVIYFQYCT